MKDPAVPSLSVVNDGDIAITIPTTDTLVNSQGYTYNQAGFSYNQAGVSYGGIYYQNQDVTPILSQAIIEQPSLNVISDALFFDLSLFSTDALLYDQGYRYNQSGISYNHIGIAYGGIYYQNQDVVPMSLSFEDIYTKSVPPTPPITGNVGPGWFMYINLN